jgi:hypothetical protein
VFCASHNLVAMTASDHRDLVVDSFTNPVGQPAADAIVPARQLGEIKAAKALLSHFSASTAWRGQPDNCHRTLAVVGVVGDELGDVAGVLAATPLVEVNVARLTQTPREPVWDRSAFAQTLQRDGAERLDALWIPGFLIGVGPTQVREAFAAVAATQTPGVRVLAHLNAGYSPATAQEMLIQEGLHPTISQWVDGAESQLVLIDATVVRSANQLSCSADK